MIKCVAKRTLHSVNGEELFIKGKTYYADENSIGEHHLAIFNEFGFIAYYQKKYFNILN